MAAEKTVGILGGMGPEATLNLFEKILANTPATVDQEHFRIIIDNNPKVPDRTLAITGNGESPVPILVQGGQTLEKAGADFIVMPCISAHYFLEAIRSELKVPILSVFDEVTVQIKESHPAVQTVGLMATTGTVEGGLFQKRLAEDNMKTLTPDAEAQEQVMSAIYQIKRGAGAHRKECKTILQVVANKLIENGAESIIAGCTEIPLELTSKDVSVPLFDPLQVLAQAAVREAKP
jgi:aspartate racemase